MVRNTVRSSSAIPNLVGHTIDDGRLRFIDVIGSGSSGVVFLAVDTTSSVSAPTKYAVKCLVRAQKGTQRHELQNQEVSFHRRASRHPNVVTLHRVVEDVYYLFLVLQYYPGGDLYSFLHERKAIRGNDALVKMIFLQILDAVEACHDIGIFHRDIKPENILVSEDGTHIYLSDFGLATRSVWSTSYGRGSSYYMSPECLGVDIQRGGYCTGMNDIWALGVILTTMLTAHNPWRCAVPSDPCYASYLRNRNYLYRMLPISAEANTILQRVFTSDPMVRIPIAHLRIMILQTKTFFLSAAQIACASNRLKNVAEMYYELKTSQPEENRAPPPSLETSNDSSLGKSPPGFLEHCDAYIDSVAKRVAEPHAELLYTGASDILRVPRIHPTNSDETAESDGPLTPELEAPVNFPATCNVKTSPTTTKPFASKVFTSGKKVQASSAGLLRRVAGMIFV